jgi:hypothetical protein
MSDNIYLNISINPTNANGNSLAIYDESFNRSIVEDIKDRYFSVVRFSIPTSEIPIFNFPVDVSQNNPLVSNLIIGIRNAGNNFSQTVNFIPTNDFPLPTASGSAPFFTTAQIISKCYNIFSVSAFINMVNVALSSAYAASGIPGVPPAYSYNPTTELISLSIPLGFTAAAAELYMNESLSNYFASFQFYQRYSDPVRQYTHIFPAAAGPLTISEDYKSLGLWFDIRKIILTSSSLPVSQESTPTQDGYTGLSQGVISRSSTLTDFVVSFDSPSQILNYATYTPDTYRLIDMSKSNVPINKLSLQFFWQNKQGTLIPLEISNTQVATLKLGFFKKSLYNNEY